jgi:transglutaminase-like putative cysteine protease
MAKKPSGMSRPAQVFGALCASLRSKGLAKVGGKSLETIWIVGKVGLLVVGAIIIGLPLYALPATLSLPAGPRPGIERLTLAEAAGQLEASGKTGGALAEAARALVAGRMQYSRRNSLDSPAEAFERGYGYCTQQAYALTGLLARLGIEAWAVYAFRNQFPDGTVGGHTWVRIRVDGVESDIDSLHYDAKTGELAFTPLSGVKDHSPAFKWLTKWGEAAVNAHRYYRTGKDRE